MLPAAITVIILLAVLLCFAGWIWTIHERVKDLEDANLREAIDERRGPVPRQAGPVPPR
jgi:hypothetical protein